MRSRIDRIIPLLLGLLLLAPGPAHADENTSRLLRQYFPKGINLSGYSQAELNRTAPEFNQRPRKTLAFHCPAEVLNDNVALTG